METRNVLFVDDEKSILNSIRRLLRSETYNCYFASGGEEALDFLEKETVHVIVSDLGMPKMNGIELLKTVRERHPYIIRLVLSAYYDTDSILNAISIGNVYRYIVKPWQDMELKIIINQAIDMFNLQQEKRDLLKELEEYNRLLEKRVEERTRQLLASQNKAEVGKHASQVVNNLLTPLNAIKALVEYALFESHCEDPDIEKVSEYLQNIKSDIFDLEKIIAGILIHVRDERQFSSTKVSINDIILRELELFELNYVYKDKIRKNISLSDSLPMVSGNPVHFKQIIDNLVKNAIDAMEDSPEKLLNIQTSLKDKTIFIEISDTGEGIYKGELDKIFSPDFSTKPIDKGIGLGLASVKTMVDAYEGDINVESEKGKGATFTVRIPVETEYTVT